MSKHGDRGGSGLGYGRQLVPTVLIQSINQWLYHYVKQESYQKIVPELDPTNSRYPSLNYPRSRIECILILALITSFWRIRCIWRSRKSLESSHLSRTFFYSLATFDYFFFYFNLLIYSSVILSCSQNWEKACREWQFWLEGKLMMV